MDIPMELPSEGLAPTPSAGLSEVATPQAFGAGVGQALAVGGEVATKLARDRDAEMKAEQQRQDQVAVMAAHNALTSATIDKLYHPDHGILNQNLGIDAPPAVDKTLADVSGQASKIGAGLANDEQRQAFGRISADHSLQVKRELYAYEHQQTTRYANEQTNAAVQNSQTVAVQTARTGDMPGDVPGAWAKRVADQIATGNQALRQSAERNGVPPDRAVAENTSSTHLAVIGELLATDKAGVAKSYYDANAGALTKGDAERAAAMVKTGGDQSEARDLANDIIAKQHVDSVGPTGPEDQSKLTMENALARLEQRGVANVRVHDEAEQRIIHHFNLQKEAHKAAQGDLVEQATRAIDDKGNVGFNVPANVLGSLDLKEKEAVLRYQTQMRKFGRTETDEGTRLTLREMAADPQQWDEFSKLKPELYKGYLNNVDYRAFENEVAQVQGKVSRRDASLSQATVSTQVAKTIMDENGLVRPPGLKDTDPAFQEYAARRNRFMDQLNRSVQADSLAKKRELTPEEVGEKARALFATQTWQQAPSWFDRNIPTPLTTLHAVTDLVPGKIWDSTQASGPAYLAPGADQKAYSTKDIPSKSLQKMLSADQATGHTRSADELVRDYNDFVIDEAAKATRGR